MRRWCLAVVGLCIAFSAHAQTARHGGGKTWTTDAIFEKEGPTGTPPRGFRWKTNGAEATYLSADTEHGQPNDIVGVDAASGRTSVLVPATNLTAIYNAPNDERDRDHRERYSQPSYFWSPKGDRILFDTNGTIWLYDVSKGVPRIAANSRAGSGDDPKFSPDGKLVSFIRDHNLHVLTIAGGHDAAITDTTEDTLLNGAVDWVYDEELNVRSNYFWSSDSKHIAYLQMDEATVPTYPITDWLPTHSTVYQQRYPQPGDPNPGVRVGIVAAKGGETRWLHVPIAGHNDYVPAFGWLDNHHVWIEVLRRDQKQMDLYFANSETGTVRKVMGESDKKFLPASYDVNFLGNGQFLWNSWRDGHSHMYLYSYDSKDPLKSDVALIRQLTQGDWEVLSVTGLDTKKGIVYYTSNETDPREEMLWQINLDGTDKKMLSTKHGVHEISFSPDNSHYIDTFSSVMEAPVASICDLSGRCHSFWQSKPLDGYKLVAPISFAEKASDGTTLFGQLLLPPDMIEVASVPLIVNPYGGSDVQTVRDEFGGQPFLFDELLMQHGFAVLHVDNRGMGNRGRAFADAAYHDFGSVQLQDQLTVLDQILAKYPQLDAKRMGWWGWSWGGTFTLYAMTHSDRFVAGFAVAPVTSWNLYDSIYTERYLGLPVEDKQAYRDDSVVNSATHLHGNLLMAQGTGDDNVHMQNTIQIIQQFVTAAVPYRLLLYPRKTHSIAGFHARVHLFNAIERQFEENLKPSSGGSN